MCLYCKVRKFECHVRDVISGKLLNSSANLSSFMPKTFTFLSHICGNITSSNYSDNCTLHIGFIHRYDGLYYHARSCCLAYFGSFSKGEILRANRIPTFDLWQWWFDRNWSTKTPMRLTQVFKSSSPPLVFAKRRWDRLVLREMIVPIHTN